MIASLYVHVPFCNAVCDYCDFFSVPLGANYDSALIDSYLDAALDDVADQLACFSIDTVPTVYIGGGTPSALGASRVEEFLSALHSLLPNPPGEFTVEANPESLSKAFLQACVNGGADRLSLGVQSFHEESRRAVRRAGDGPLLEKSLALAAEYFPGAFCADLITGLPFQSMDILKNDIRLLLSRRPAHVSLYSLTLDPQTPLGRRVSQKGSAALSLPGEEDAANLWIAGRDMLEREGFAQYEISNFSPPEKESAHNMRYWRMESWIGAGAGASGTLIDDESGTGRRYTYENDIASYIESAKPRVFSAKTEELRPKTLIRESLLMGLRCREGIDLLRFKRRFKRDLAGCIPKTIASWRKQGLLTESGGSRLALSGEGMLLLNGFLTDAYRELENSVCTNPCSDDRIYAEASAK